MKFMNISYKSLNIYKIFKPNTMTPSTNPLSWNPLIWFSWIPPIFLLCDYWKASIRSAVVPSKWLNASAFKLTNLHSLYRCSISMTHFTSYFWTTLNHHDFPHTAFSLCSLLLIPRTSINTLKLKISETPTISKTGSNI